MKNIKPLIILYWITICLSCNSKESEIISNFEEFRFNLADFKKTIPLKSKVFRFDSILSPHQLLIKNNKLIVSSLTSNNGLFILDRKLMKLERTFGKIGFGPDEIPDVWQLDPGMDSDSFWVYSFNGKEFVKFSILPENNDYLKKLKLRDESIQSLTMNWVKEDEWIGYQNLGDSRFVIFDSEYKKLKSIGNWSNDKENIVSVEGSFILSQLNQGTVSLSPNKKVLVQAQVMTDSFEIINLETGKITKISGPIKQELDYTIELDGNSPFPLVNPDMKAGYNHLFITENNIYLVFVGRNEKEIMNTGIISKDIFVFDHSGTPLIHYQLDKSIKSISIDERSKKIYAITFEKEPGIAVFEF